MFKLYHLFAARAVCIAPGAWYAWPMALAGATNTPDVFREKCGWHGGAAWIPDTWIAAKMRAVPEKHVDRMVGALLRTTTPVNLAALRERDVHLARNAIPTAGFVMTLGFANFVDRQYVTFMGPAENPASAIILLECAFGRRRTITSALFKDGMKF